MKNVFFKHVSNNDYGKTVENSRKRINARLVNNAKGYENYGSKPIFVSQKIFSENFVAIHETKTVLTLIKSMYVVFSVLDLSKYLCMTFITIL